MHVIDVNKRIKVNEGMNIHMSTNEHKE